jgi:hypothetical protein
MHKLLPSSKDGGLHQSILDADYQSSSGEGQEATSVNAAELDAEVLSLLSYTMEGVQDAETGRTTFDREIQHRSRSQERVLRAVAIHNNDINHIPASHLGGCVGRLLSAVKQIWIELSSAKPLLLLTNAANYLWFLSCYHVFQFYKAQDDSDKSEGALWASAIGILLATYLSTWVALWINKRARQLARHRLSSITSSRGISMGSAIALEHLTTKKKRDKRAKVTEKLITQFSAAGTFVSMLAIHDTLKVAA